ncbi:MAG: aryl-sulfate sulfotransferase [Acidobacteria bacterium]|nr:aryl-sulfate sulfotransferase [Acidobacteriota bacterium]
MKSNLLRIVGIAALVLAAASGPGRVSACGALRGPTELQYWDVTRAYNGYTLFAAKGKTYLVDMLGRVVHSWNLGTNPHLLDDGHILDAASDDPSGFSGFKELDWNGSTAWSYLETRSTYAPHHDFARVFNPKLQAWTTMYIANKTVTQAQAIAAGCDPANGPYDGAQADAIVEVDAGGTVVWEWWFFDHAVQDIDATKANYVGAGKTIADYPGRIDLNMPGRPLKKDWLHCNAMDYNPDLDQVVINSVQGEFYVIDHGNTFVVGDPTASIALAASSAGDFLYRFGDPSRYEQGTKPSTLTDWTEATTGNRQMGGTHDIQWIRSGLPGAGHFMVFNNAQYLFEHTPQSSILEIDGFRDASGNNLAQYVNPPDAGYTTVTYPDVIQKSPRLISNQVVWSYASRGNQGFFSHIGSSGQRLPNGNTLICSDTEGHFFEVTAEGRLVWEYILPVTSGGIVTTLLDNLPMTSSAFRAYRYGADHPALAGRDLTPGATLTGTVPPTRPPVVWGSTLAD